MKPYIQPFERRLALAELERLSGSPPSPMSSEDNAIFFGVQTHVPPHEIASRLAYWEVVEHGGQALPTTQSLRESTMRAGKSSLGRHQLELRVQDGTLAVPNGTPDLALPNRRCLRYGPHGIHEYRGKFFPQLVRAFLNIAGVPRGGLVVDPMSGSGTTAVESLLSDCHALGLDLNPLSVFVARTKCRVLFENPDELVEVCSVASSEVTRKRRRGFCSQLPEQDVAYLESWFHPEIFRDLDALMTTLSAMTEGAARDLMFVAVSNILRSISWQKEDDLRARKDVRSIEGIDVIARFREELDRSLRQIVGLLRQLGADVPPGSWVVAEGDARASGTIWRQHVGHVDAVVTSPPYATALPYLDTDRLSLSFLGLLPRSEHRRRDLAMIGNRELNDGLRRQYLERFERDRRLLPDAVASLVQRVDTLNANADVGFRRRNMSALLAKYFFDMREVLLQYKALLKKDGYAFVVVGNNSTTAGDELVDIKTASHLSELAVACGLRLVDRVPMEMLVSRDIFRKNAIGSEEIIILRNESDQV